MSIFNTKRLDTHATRIQQLEWDKRHLDLTVHQLSREIEKLEQILLDAGIIENEWKPEAPEGSVIRPTHGFNSLPSYTKVNKVI